MGPISSYDLDALAECFDREVPKPAWRRWLGSLDNALEVQLACGPVKVGKIKEAFRGFTGGPRYTYAAWKWLRPRSPIPTTRNLPAIQRLATLDHVAPVVFAERLVERCRDIARDHQELALWVNRRIPPLEYVCQPPGRVPDEIADATMTWRMAIIRAASGNMSIGAVEDAAARILERAMDAAAQEVESAIGARDSRISANLMVPIPGREDALGRFVEDDPRSRQNNRRAVDLWGEPDPKEPRLVIVAETQGSNHKGFWVPLFQGDSGTHLPGAPTAFAHRQGNAVFKDDLPPLRGFPHGTDARWRAYMVNDFREKLFVSLPFQAPTAKGRRVTAAVLNVNADAADLGPWRRLYHDEWVCAARDRVRPLIEVACAAFLIMMSREQGAFLDTGSALWNSLPIRRIHRLPGGKP